MPVVVQVVTAEQVFWVREETYGTLRTSGLIPEFGGGDPVGSGIAVRRKVRPIASATMAATIGIFRLEDRCRERERSVTELRSRTGRRLLRR
jgi:hypothetical protein